MTVMTKSNITEKLKDIMVAKPRAVKAGSCTFLVRHGEWSSKILLEMPAMMVRKVCDYTHSAQVQASSMSLQVNFDEVMGNGAAQLMREFCDGVVEKTASKIAEFRTASGALSTTELRAKNPVPIREPDEFSGE